MGLTFSHVASLVIVPELQSLVDSCGSTTGHCGSKQTLKSQKGVLQLSLALSFYTSKHTLMKTK